MLLCFFQAASATSSGWNMVRGSGGPSWGYSTLVGSSGGGSGCHPGMVTTGRGKPRPVYRHQCTVCGSTHLTPAHLARHFRTHTGEKPFPCPRCDSRFTQKVSLQKHLRTKHQEILSPSGHVGAGVGLSVHGGPGGVQDGVVSIASDRSGPEK